MATEINQLLEELQGAGLLESRGEFSIDFLKACEKMATRRLPDSRMYILRLVQSAVSAGSHQIDIDHSFRTLSFRGHGWSLPHQHIQELHSFLLKNSQDPLDLPAQYLAVALNAALDQNPERLHLVSWDGQAGVSLSFVGHQEGLEMLTVCPFSTPQPQTCFTIVHRSSWFFRKLPELEWLYKQCSLSPTPIFVNGIWLLPDFGQPKDLDTLRLYLPFTYISSSTSHTFGKNRIVHVNQGHHLLLGKIPAGVHDNQPEMLRIPDVASCNTLLGNANGHTLVPPPAASPGGGTLVRTAIGLRADLRKAASVRFVIHGVSLDPVPLEVKHPGVEAVAGGSGLATDLSGCKLREDELKPHLLELQEHADNLWSQHLKKWGNGAEKPDYESCMAHAISGESGSTYGHF